MESNYTNVVQLINKLVSDLKLFIENNNLIGNKEANNLIEGFEAFKELLSDPIVSKELDNYKLTVQNPIEKYGIADEVITMLEAGEDYKAVADHFMLRGLPISKKDVSSFANYYQDLDVLSKIEISNSSVFDTSNQLQRIYDLLNTKTMDLDNLTDEQVARARTTREQIWLEFMKEQRQTLDTARRLSDSIFQLQQSDQFRKIVLGTVQRECGSTVFNKVMAELNKQKLIFGFGL